MFITEFVLDELANKLTNYGKKYKKCILGFIYCTNYKLFLFLWLIFSNISKIGSM